MILYVYKSEYWVDDFQITGYFKNPFGLDLK